VGNLFGQYADLMEGFNKFLAQLGKNGSVQHQNKFSHLLSLDFHFFIASTQRNIFSFVFVQQKILIVFIHQTSNGKKWQEEDLPKP